MFIVSECAVVNSFVPVQVLFMYFYFWLAWVFLAAHRLSVVTASGGYSSLQCEGLELPWLLLLQIQV